MKEYYSIQTKQTDELKEELEKEINNSLSWKKKFEETQQILANSSNKTFQKKENNIMEEILEETPIQSKSKEEIEVSKDLKVLLLEKHVENSFKNVQETHDKYKQQAEIPKDSKVLLLEKPSENYLKNETQNT